MRIRLAAAVLALAVACTACEFDLVEVEVGTPDRETPPTLSIRASTHRDSATVVHTLFHPGTTNAGALRYVDDDSIRIDGVAHAPTEIAVNGRRSYVVSGLDPSAAEVHVRAPVVTGLPALPDVTVRVLRVVAPDTIRVHRQGVIEVVLDGLPETPGGRWGMVVYTPRDPAPMIFLSLNGYTLQPVLRLPVSLLPPSFTHGLVQVQGSLHTSFGNPQDSWPTLVVSDFVAVIPLVVHD